MISSDYIGHEAAWQAWNQAGAGARMHHGWILSGRRGVGKSAFAMAAARQLVEEGGEGSTLADHPDIYYLTHPPKTDGDVRKKADGKPYEVARNIKVSQIRELLQKLTTRPTMGARRAVIIDPADDMEPSTANALLKSLEEPPEGTYFLLVAHRLGRLLPTIRSRCRVLSFPSLAEEEMLEVLRREAPDAPPETRAAAIAAANGSPGAAIDFVELDLGKVHSIMRRLVEDDDPDLRLRASLASALGTLPSREKQLATLELARSVVASRRMTAEKADIPELVETYQALVRLGAQAPTYNFDTSLLLLEIGTLLATLGGSRTAVNA